MVGYPKHLEVEISFLSTKEGGRTQPAISIKYRPQFYFNGYDWVTIIIFQEKEFVFPGETVSAYLSFLSPEMIKEKIYNGMHFEIREGQKVVANGFVKQILEF